MANKSIAYYNEIEPAAAHVLECLIKDQVIAEGVVDRRSIAEVDPTDLAGFRQAHFFAGGGLWSVAARIAGWPDDRELWTGSAPCQPFSVAGKGAGEDDPRHLWPHFFRLIRACRPPLVVGEQVAGAAGYRWFDGVGSDLEGEDYACRAVDIPACAVDAPHIRSRLYWCAVAHASRGIRPHGLGEHGQAGQHVCNGLGAGSGSRERDRAARSDAVLAGDAGKTRVCDVEHADSQGQQYSREMHKGRGLNGAWAADHRAAGGAGGEDNRHTGDALSPRLEGHARHGDDGRQPGRIDADAARSVAEAGSGDMEHAEGVGRREGRAEHEVRGGGLASSSASSGDMAAAEYPRPSRAGREPQSEGAQHRAFNAGAEEGLRDMADADEFGPGEGRQQRGGQFLRSGENPRARNGSFWSDYEWLPGADGKAWRAQPGICLLANGVPNRVASLRIAGNAIVPQLAAEVIKALMESLP